MVLKQPGYERGGHIEPSSGQNDINSFDDSVNSGDATGSTDYEVIQAAAGQGQGILDNLKLLKSESGQSIDHRNNP